MQTARELYTTQMRVEDLLRSEPELRNSDKLLTLRVIEQIAREHKMWVHIPRELLEHLPAFESVKRCRAKLQNDERRYLPTDPQVRRQRRIRAEDFRSWAVGR